MVNTLSHILCFKIVFVQEMTSCSLVDMCQHFGVTCLLSLFSAIMFVEVGFSATLLF